MFKRTVTKQCSKCKKHKLLNEFSKSREKKDGHKVRCKKCISEDEKIYRLKYKDKLIKKRREYRKNNPEIVKKWDNDKYKKNKKKCNERTSKYYYLHKEEIREKRKIYFKKNKKKIYKYYKNLYKISPKHKLRKKITILIIQRLKNRLLSKNKKSTFTFLPYTIEELMQHLESKFKPGMTWNNYS